MYINYCILSLEIRVSSEGLTSFNFVESVPIGAGLQLLFVLSKCTSGARFGNLEVITNKGIICSWLYIIIVITIYFSILG